MGHKLKNNDFSFVKTFEYLLNYCTVHLLIYGILLFDSLEIIIYGEGILDTDFSRFLNLSTIPFFVLFFASFGIIATSLSSLANGFVLILYGCLSSKFELYVSSLFNLEPVPKNNKNSIAIGSLHEIALITENTFLLEYIKNENKIIYNAKKNHRIYYSLSIAVIFNWLVTFLYNKKTIIDFIICLYKNSGGLFIKICLSLLFIPVVLTTLYGLKHSIFFNVDRIYFPEAKYSLLREEMNSIIK